MNLKKGYLVRLKRLWIDGFKNLNDFELDFTDKEGITVLIGNNGSGKSNVLEAISAIFTGLFKMSTPQRKPKFEYEIEYSKGEDDYKLSLKKDNEEYRYAFYKNEMNIPIRTFRINPSLYLPSSLIAIYSGEEMRLWEDYYKHLYNDFMKDVRKELHSLPTPKLLYVNKFYWNIALLTLLYSELDDNIAFCKRILKTDDLDSINVDIKFNRDNLENFDTNIITSFINSFSNENIEKAYTISEIKELAFIGTEKEFFFKLMASVMSKESKYKLIDSLTIKFGEHNLNIDALSEGEKKQILLRIALEVVADENSLILMDEPDANIHVANKGKIKEMLKEYNNRESLLTTHSPTLTHTFNDKHITMIKDGQIEDKTKQEVFSHISDGIWNYQEQSIFLSSQKDIILLVEGKHDKIHIEEAFSRLKDNYKALDFDIFQMNGETNIKHMLLGLANNGVPFDGKKIIAIFDNDGAGKKGFGQNFKVVQGKEYKKLVDNKGIPSKIFFGLLLPKTNNFNKDFTIENMYNGEKNKNALQLAFNKRSIDNEFFNDFIDDVSKQIKEDAKNQLADNCKDFDDEDFKHFKKLFDLILEIKRLA